MPQRCVCCSSRHLIDFLGDLRAWSHTFLFQLFIHLLFIETVLSHSQAVPPCPPQKSKDLCFFFFFFFLQRTSLTTCLVSLPRTNNLTHTEGLLRGNNLPFGRNLSPERTLLHYHIILLTLAFVLTDSFHKSPVKKKPSADVWGFPVT